MNLELNCSSGEGERRGGGGGEALQSSGAQSLGSVSLHGKASSFIARLGVDCGSVMLTNGLKAGRKMELQLSWV